MDQAAHRTHLNTVLAEAQTPIERMHTDLKTIKQANIKINKFVREQLDKDLDWRPEELWQDSDAWKAASTSLSPPLSGPRSSIKTSSNLPQPNQPADEHDGANAEN